MLPDHLRRTVKRTGQPIAGYDPSKISERTGERVSAFAFFSSVARNANGNTNRGHATEGKKHSKMLEAAYVILRHAPSMGDNIGLLGKLTPDEYKPCEEYQEYVGYGTL